MANNSIISWAIVLVLAACYAYYLNKGKKTSPTRPAERRLQAIRKEPKVKKPREKKTHEPTQNQVTTSPFKRADGSSDDDGVDNKEFARQFSMVRNGTKVTGKKADEKKIKSVKQSRAQEKNVKAEKPSAPSSTAGIDADDDRSAEPSPVVQPADKAVISATVEAPGSSPSAIHLTDVAKENIKPKKAEKASKPSPTKKQRQRKKNAEQKKAERDEEEVEGWQKKMEAQRHLGSTSEDRPAKDEASSMASQSGGAWKDKESTNGGSSDVPAVVAPLDTFDQTSPKQASAVSNSEWIKGLPSEEEQIERVREAVAEDEWSTVESKYSKRRQRKGAKASKQSENHSITAPVAIPKPNGSSKAVGQQSSFAALNTGSESTEESEQSDSHAQKPKSTNKGYIKAPAPNVQPVEQEWDI